MNRIDNDPFYDFIKKYDPDSIYHFVGEVDYHLLTYMNGQQTGQISLTTDMNGMEHAAGLSMIRP